MENGFKTKRMQFDIENVELSNKIDERINSLPGVTSYKGYLEYLILNDISKANKCNVCKTKK